MHMFGKGLSKSMCTRSCHAIEPAQKARFAQRLACSPRPLEVAQAQVSLPVLTQSRLQVGGAQVSRYHWAGRPTDQVLVGFAGYQP